MQDILGGMNAQARGDQTHTAKESLLDRIKQLELEATARGLSNFAHVLRDARIRICELEAQTAYQEGR